MKPRSLPLLEESFRWFGPAELRANLARFLTAIVPVATEIGVRLAVHPDAPTTGTP